MLTGQSSLLSAAKNLSKRFLASAVMLSLACSVSISATLPPQPALAAAKSSVQSPTSKEARALADEVMAAFGGYENFKHFNDVPCRASGKIVQTSSLSGVVNKFDCDIVVKREKQKITIKFLGQPLTTVYDGENCWTQQGDSILPSDSITAKRIAEDIRHGFLLLEQLHFKQTRMELGKSVVVDGRPCETLLVWAEDGQPTTFAIDKDSHLVLSSSYPGVDLEQGLKIEKSYVYSDYRAIANTRQPFKVVEFSGNKKVSETLISDVVIDESIQDNFFNMPKEQVPARLAAGPVSFPFEYQANEIVAKAKINGKDELRFIVDTGATQSIIDKSVAKQIGIAAIADGGGLSMTTGSGSIQTDAVNLNSLSLGDLELKNVPFCVADLNSFGQAQRPAGLIGANILKRFLVTIDYENQRITLADPSNVKVPDGAVIVNTKPSLGMSGLAVDGNLDGKQKVSLLIDTGAAFNNISESKVKGLLWGPVYKAGMLKGLDGKLVQTGAARFNYLDIDKLRIDKPVFSIAPSATESQTPSGIITSKDLAIIGNPLLSQFKITFDYRNQRLIVEQSPTQKAMAEFKQKLDAIKMDWLRGRNANQAIRDLQSLADSAHNKDIPANEAIARAEMALMICQKNGGDFSPEHIFSAMHINKPGEKTKTAGNNEKPSKEEKGAKASKVSSKDLSADPRTMEPQAIFTDAEALLLQAYNISEKCPDKSIQGRVLAIWGFMYCSQSEEFSYLTSAKQKMGRAVILAPADADVLAASGYFLTRLESARPIGPEAAVKIDKAIKASMKDAKNGKNSAKESGKESGSDSKKDDKKAVTSVKDARNAVKSVNELGKWLAEQIIDQAIMIDPANYLALNTKLERARMQGASDDIKSITAQLKHYYPNLPVVSLK